MLKRNNKKNIIAIGIISSIAILNAVVFAFAQPEEERERENAMERDLFVASTANVKILKIGLLDCMLFALKNNSDIKIKKIEPLISEQKIKVAESDFEPSLDINASLEDSKEQTFSSLIPGSSRTTKFDVGLDKKFPTGTEIDLDYQTKKYKSNLSYQTINPYYKTEAEITITQPLLKDFGVAVNKAEILIEANSKAISERELQNTAIEIISSTKKFYYEYLLSQEQYRLAQISQKRALDLFSIIQERYDNGMASSVDLLDAKTGVAEKEENLLTIEGKVRFAEDNLKLITNLVEDPELWNAEIEVIDRPELKLENVNLLESLKGAFECRPDYKSAEIELETQDLKIIQKKNAVLPTIDFVGTLGINGLDRSYKEAFSNMADGIYRTWSAGVNVSLPFGNKKAIAEYEMSRLLKKQLLLNFKNLQQKIILDVRDSVRKIDIAKRKINAVQKRLDAEVKRYSAANSRFSQGLVSADDMLEYEEDLFSAEINYIDALISYNEEIINLDKNIGVTLAKNNINFIEGE